MSGYDGDHRTLDVEPGGSLEEIKRAYRGLAHIWHGDRPASDDTTVDSKPSKELKHISEVDERVSLQETRAVPTQSRPAALPQPYPPPVPSTTSQADGSTTGHGGRSTRAPKVGSRLAIGAAIAFLVILVIIVAVGPWQPQPLTQSQTSASPTASAQLSVENLPDEDMELQPQDPVISARPYENPKFDDPLYDPLKEADVKSHKAMRQYRRGVFVGYGEISAAGPLSTPAPASELAIQRSQVPARDTAPLSQPSTTPVPPSYRVVNVAARDFLNLRAGPGSTYPAVTRIRTGTRGITLGRDRVANGSTIWQEISVGGYTGWVNEIYLEAEQPMR